MTFNPFGSTVLKAKKIGQRFLQDMDSRALGKTIFAGYLLHHTIKHPDMLSASLVQSSLEMDCRGLKWKSVLCSDESAFQIVLLILEVVSFRRKETRTSRLLPACSSKAHICDDGGVMVPMVWWVTFTWVMAPLMLKGTYRVWNIWCHPFNIFSGTSLLIAAREWGSVCCPDLSPLKMIVHYKAKRGKKNKHFHNFII